MARLVGFVTCYRPQTKLREGNVFTGVCLFTGAGREGRYITCIMHHGIGRVGYPLPTCASHLGTYPPLVPPPPRHQTWGTTPSLLLLTSGGHHWRHVQTCSLEDLTPHPRGTVLTYSGGP